ncbi:MAG: ATP-dependent DNA helicase RecG [Bifidobacteriaceae bacterium]|nr:ATP-dependent DNA helicase RecG [Bifidobacteriaceae bacterium]
MDVTARAAWRGASEAAAPNHADAYLGQRVERAIGRGGKKLAAAGVRTVGDLLRHYPKRYDDPRVPTDMAGLKLEEVVSINARVAAVSVRDIKQRTQWLVSVQITDGAHRLALTFFLKRFHLVDFYTSQYRVGRMGLFTGKVSLYRGQQQLVHPEVVWEDALRDQDPRFADKLIPIYPAVAGIQSPQLQNAIRTALKALGDEPPTDPLPESALADRRLPPLGQAFWDIHNPAGPHQWQAARRRFRFEEAFVLQTGLARRRHQLETAASAKAWPVREGPDSLVARLDAALPFELTQAQRQVGAKLSRLLAADRPMNQLLQGDVGSGKTVVALRAMLQVVAAGGQAAMLAPTEVLAAQHRRTIEDLLRPLGLARPGQADDAAPGQFAPAVRLLTGAVGAKSRANLLDEIAQGQAQIVIGTHALLEESVKFRDLGLVVVDEQHRFGVEQREALRAKAGLRPHLLVMTATPIPRTVAMTVFGDLGLSVLGQSPPGRPAIATTWVNPRQHPTWLDRVWTRLAEEARAGRRGLVVCPAIEPGEFEPGEFEPGEFEPGGEPDPDRDREGGAEQGQLAFGPPAAPRGQLAFGPPAAPQGQLAFGPPAAQRGQLAFGPPAPTTAPEPRRPLASVSQTLARLREHPALVGVRLAPLHGRMTSQEKDQTMAAFGRGDIDVLVATTVVEVGIDVPQATALVVLDADRFGLSQLHQLRGRVGRGQDPGVCLLVSEAETDSLAARRLRALEETRDGFALAEVDLETRREGEILGDSQSGRSSLRLVRLTSDAELIEAAREAAAAVIAEDPGLARRPALRQAVDALLAGRDDYLERG